MIMKDFDKENPRRATAVIATLMEVTSPVPNFRVKRSDMRLAAIVPPEIIMETIPANDSGTLNESFIAGHAEPSNESGKPRLTNAM